MALSIRPYTYSLAPLDLPVRMYYLSPVGDNTKDSTYFNLISLLAMRPHSCSELQNQHWLRDLLKVNVQLTRRVDILKTFKIDSRDRSIPSLLLFAESLRVSSVLSLSWHHTDRRHHEE